MFDKDKILNLNKTYNFDVNVEDEIEGKFFSGKLILSPDKCTLRVMGERSTSFSFHSPPVSIKCYSFQNYYFLLSEIIGMHGGWTNLEKNIGFFECEFSIGFVVCSDRGFIPNEKIANFIISAPMFEKWIGMTTVQWELVEKYQNRGAINPHSDLIEFEQALSEHGKVTLFYKMTTHCNPHSFSLGAQFPPQFKVELNSIEYPKLHNQLNIFYDLLTLFVGSDFKIDTIKIFTEHTRWSENISVYFLTSNRTLERNYPVFPLGHNLRFKDLPLPELPIECIRAYYNLSEADKLIFTKYLRYKRMKSDEEKFLGYFRLLEKLTHKTSSYVDQLSLGEILNNAKSYLLHRLKGTKKDINSLIERVKGINQHKYNSEKCIGDFYNSLPSKLKKNISYKKDDLIKICSLRNNITHANDYIVSEEDLAMYTSFINVLLYLALLKKIGIPPEVSAAVIPRLEGYHLIIKNESSEEVKI